MTNAQVFAFAGIASQTDTPAPGPMDAFAAAALVVGTPIVTWNIAGDILQHSGEGENAESAEPFAEDFPTFEGP